jgi:uncharacterized protein YraI
MKSFLPFCLSWIFIGIGLNSALAACAPSGDYVVIDVKWNDPIGGLAIRSAPNDSASLRGIIPPAGTGIGIGQCRDTGWCEVHYQCTSGWSFLARYLAPRVRRLYRVVDVSANDPEGLNLRDGPGAKFSEVARIPYSEADLIVHYCEEDAGWCFVSYGQNYGWAAQRFLAAVGATPVPTPQPLPVPPPSAPTPPPPQPSPDSRACQMFPNLC